MKNTTYKEKTTLDEEKTTSGDSVKKKKSAEDILEFCVALKSILEITDFPNLKEKKSARRHVKPLLERGV